MKRNPGCTVTEPQVAASVAALPMLTPGLFSHGALYRHSDPPFFSPHLPMLQMNPGSQLKETMAFGG